MRSGLTLFHSGLIAFLVCAILTVSNIDAYGANITGIVTIKPKMTSAEYKKQLRKLSKDDTYKVSAAKRVDYEDAVENVVVYIEKAEGEFTPAGDNPKLIQKSAKFSSPVVPIVTGTTVDFPNNDNIFHNIFSYSRVKAFDLGLFKSGVSKSVTFNKVGHVPVYCSIHRNMKAEIIVLQNPYFSVTDKKGMYTIENVPPGTYKVVSWQDRIPEWSKEITIKDGDKELKLDIQMGFELPEVE